MKVRAHRYQQKGHIAEDGYDKPSNGHCLEKNILGRHGRFCRSNSTPWWGSFHLSANKGLIHEVKNEVE